MGTTIIVAICTPNFATIAHIGDSRCYMVNEGGFKHVTEDHSLVNELVRHWPNFKGRCRISPEKKCYVKSVRNRRKSRNGC